MLGLGLQLKCLPNVDFFQGYLTKLFISNASDRCFMLCRILLKLSMLSVWASEKPFSSVWPFYDELESSNFIREFF